MKIIERVIETPRLILLGGLLLCALGAVALFDLPKERAPRIRLPVVLVVVPNPGAGPATNEREIVRRIEQEARGLKGLKGQGGIHSQALHGAAAIQFVFDDGVKVRDAKQDVHNLLDRLKGDLPPSAENPIVADIAFEDFPIIQVFVAGGGDGRQRRRTAERLKDQIEGVAGVAGVDVFGGLEDEVQIEVDPHRMTLYGFTYEQIQAAVRRANAEAPAGAIESRSGMEQRVRVPSKLGSVEEIAAVPLGVREGKPVVLGDVAQVRLGHKPVESIARYGGQDAAVLLVRAKTDIDVMRSADAIQGVVDQFVAAGESQGAHIGTVRSQSREIRYMLSLLGNNAWQGVLLVVIMLWIVFGWRNAGIISLAFPFCVLVTAGLMWAAKRTFYPDLAINNIVLFGLILVMGEVADGSIVVAENIYRHRELGRSPLEAAKRGMREVGVPVLFSYLTTCAAFAPFLLVRGVMGEFLSLLPIVTFFALGAAMIVDHLLLPVVSVYIMRSPRRPPAAGPTLADLTSLSQDEQEIAQAQALSDASPLRRAYGRLLERLLPQRRLVLATAVGATLVPVALFVSGAVDFELFPEADVPVVEVRFELPLGSSMERRTLAAAEQLEAAVVRAVRPEEWYQPGPGAARVKPVTTLGNPGALNARLDAPMPTGPEFGMVYVELELAEDRQRTAAEIRRAIEDELPPLPGVIVRVTSPKEGPPAGAPVLLRVLGRSETSPEQLAARAEELEALLRSVPGTRDVTSDHRVRPEISVAPDRAVASLFGLDAAHISHSVNYALDGVLIDKVDFGADKEIDLRLRNLAGQRDTIADLLNLPLRSPTGKIVSLEQVAHVERTVSPHVLQRYDQKRVINLRAELEPGTTADDVKMALATALRPELSAPQRHALVYDRRSLVLHADEATLLEFGGENQMRDEAAVDLMTALALALLGNYVLFVIQFNSFRKPLLILASVPLSWVGVSLGLLIWGLNFSVSALIGIVALSGIIVDNAMVLIEFTNKMRQAGVPARRAVVYAAQLRIRPILLTTLTNIVGLIPVSLNLAGGGELWQPLAVAVMGGLGFGTLIQLFVVPLAYYSFERNDRYRQYEKPEPEPAHEEEAEVPAELDHDDLLPGVAG